MATNTGKKRGLVGGAAGEPEDSFLSPFVHNGVKAINLARKNKYGLRLLPGFNMNLDKASDDFRTSTIPYRDADAKLDPETGLAPFSGFYYILRGYKFIGNEKAGFLSPLNLEERDRLGVDPLFDMYRTAKNSNNPEWKAFTDKPEKVSDGYGARLPYISQHVLANALVDIDGVLENRVIIFGIAGLKMLKEYLNILRPAAETNIIDPNWPDLLYGDVTSVDYGLWATVKETKYNDAATAACFHFSQQRDRLVNHVPFPIDISTEDGLAALRGRYDISDTDAVTKIWTGEEIMDFIIRDNFYPYDLIQEACGKHWEIPAESTNPTYSTPEPAAAAKPPGLTPPGAAKPAAAKPPVAASKPPVTTAPPRPPVAAAAAAKPAATKPPVTTPKPPVAAPAPPRPPVKPAGMTPPSNVPKPPGAAAKPPVRPPVKPAPVAPPAPEPEPEPAPEPEPTPEAADGAVEPVEGGEAPVEGGDAPPVWTEEDEAAYQELETKFMSDSNGLDQAEMGRYAELGDRRAVAAAQQ